jgi:hypothetical protein
MARAIRIEFAGAFYHVMNRGDNGAKIFYGKKGQKACTKSMNKKHEDRQNMKKVYR